MLGKYIFFILINQTFHLGYGARDTLNSTIKKAFDEGVLTLMNPAWAREDKDLKAMAKSFLSLIVMS